MRCSLSPLALVAEDKSEYIEQISGVEWVEWCGAVWCVRARGMPEKRGLSPCYSAINLRSVGNSFAPEFA